MLNVFSHESPSGKPTGEIRVAVVSDLHAFERSLSAGTAPSFLEVGAAEDSAGVHPVAGLLNLITDKSLEADLLLCPGDLGDKSQPTAIKHAWDQIQSIGAKLKVAHIVATAGNHDIDSRHSYNSHDARGFLQSLNPYFPFDNETVCDRFWSRHFAVLSWPNLRIVMLNSSAYHGAAAPANGESPEYTHGRIASSTLERLEECLKSENTTRLNILLCHHHPQPLDEFGLGAADVMTNGSELLRLLGSGTYGEWFIIHGHKHYPKLSYAQGDTSVSPIVFAAGSMCASLPPAMFGKARNQFYILTFPDVSQSSFGLVGRFRAWDFNHGIGWQRAQTGSGLPHHGGFGIREKPDIFANIIVTECLKKRQTQWTELVSRFPKLEYLLPKDLSRVVGILQDRNDLRVLESDGSVAQIDRIT